jgi:hypothetical protein
MNCEPQPARVTLTLDGDRINRSASVKRQRRTRSDHKYVRLVSGSNLYQARIWHPVVGSINLGLYDTDTAAAQVVRNWINAGCDPCRGLPEGVLPKWVKLVEGQFYGSFAGRRAIASKHPDDVGPFATAEEAHAAMRGRYQRKPRCWPTQGTTKPRVIIVDRGTRFVANAFRPDVPMFHFGTFATRFEAERVAEEWLRHGADPCQHLPPGVLPKWVSRHTRKSTGKTLYRASMRIDGYPVSIQRDFATPEAAFDAALRIWRKWRKERASHRAAKRACEVTTNSMPSEKGAA